MNGKPAEMMHFQTKRGVRVRVALRHITHLSAASHDAPTFTIHLTGGVAVEVAQNYGPGRCEIQRAIEKLCQ